MKYFFKSIGIVLILGYCTMPVFLQAAAEVYENKELIPGQTSTSNFVEYLGNLYNFGIGIAVILALFMIALGSFTYIVTSAGNASKMIDAKNMIFNAIFGLVLALTAFLLLFIINPDLVEGTMRGPVDVIEDITQ